MIKNQNYETKDEQLNTHLNTSKPSIFTKKIRSDYKIIPYNTVVNTLGPTRHFPSSTKEWSNSIYAYNNNSIKNLPVLDKTLSKIIKSYLNLSLKKRYLNFSKSPNKRLKTRFKRLSVWRIFVAKAELKHTNEKVLITLFVHDSKAKFLKRLLSSIRSFIFTMRNMVENIKNIPKGRYPKVLSIITNPGKKPEIVRKEFLYKEHFETLANNYMAKSKYFINKIFPVLVRNKRGKSLASIWKLNYFAAGDTIKKIRRIKKGIMKVTRRWREILLQKSVDNKKLNNYIYRLTPLISRLYGKKVEFNIIKLNNIYLNSDIFTQAIAIKLKNRDNKLLRVIRSALFLIKMPPVNRMREKYGKSDRGFLWINKVKNWDLESLDLPNNKAINPSDLYNEHFNDDLLSEYLVRVLPSNQDKSLIYNPSSPQFNHPEWALESIGGRPLNSNGNLGDFSNPEKNLIHKLNNFVYSNIKYKLVEGARIEAKGRLTRRFTASRSVFKVRWKGGLKNVESSYRGVSTVILRGHARPNVQYSIVNSKTRNGAFGIKGWISGK